ncbi:hypothetical protein [Ciceribacter sp. L1K22]|uniref:hypothetical protein n=1 Tax=Ciceribacter sp. L1K22 TaxID=2820275 RepID=UPI001ABE3C25|nr:hypothetical protein [Ciceribacter sp. L1K22]MBO3759284.1 hypothetical protein [Ciceribacter sp. L1K22]
MLSSDIVAFIEGRVMMLFATRDEAHRPMIGRGSGARFDAATGLVSVLVSSSQWPRAVANARAGLPVATTYVNPETYHAYQIKGVITETHPADSAESEWGARYVREQLELMTSVGVSRLQLSSTLSDRDLVVVTFRPLDIFRQTPGPGAGQKINARGEAAA